MTILTLKTTPRGDRWNFAENLIKKSDGKPDLTESVGLGGLLSWFISNAGAIQVWLSGAHTYSVAAHGASQSEPFQTEASQSEPFQAEAYQTEAYQTEPSQAGRISSRTLSSRTISNRNISYTAARGQRH